MLSVNVSLYNYSSSSHNSIFNFTIPFSLYVSYLLTKINYENVILHIMAALFNFLKFWMEVRMHPPVSFFLRIISSSFQKDKNVARLQGSYGTGANRQADTHTHIYIYIFNSFIVLATTSRPSRRSQKKKSTLSTELHGEENNIFEG